MGLWQRSAGGLWLPAAEPPPAPEPAPDVELRPPRFPDEATTFGGGGFYRYLDAMAGRPCKRCRSPVARGEEHETMCVFRCPACGWWVRVHAGGRMETTECGRPVAFTVRGG